ncbi:MAG: hypothetical protein AAF598_02865 [Bacteroidota bacterium]
MKAHIQKSIFFGGIALLLISVVVAFNYQNRNSMEKQIHLNQLPSRQGDRPRTTNTNPHTQLNQQPDDLSFIQELMDWAFKMHHIERRPSAISVPGAVAMCMDHAHTCKACNAFMVGTEFAHFHPHPDYSMHLGLRKTDAELFIEKGWGEWHPLIKRGFLPPNIIMLYAPRDAEELEVAKLVLGRSYAYAKGEIE